MIIKRRMLLSLVVCLGFSGLVLGADNKDVALVLKATGKVGLNPPGRSTWVAAKRGHRLHDGIKVKTGANSLAALVFTDDKTLMKVRSNSNLTIKGKREKQGIVKRLSLSFGQIWAKVTKQNVAMRVETPSGVATVKGTIFNALYVNGNFIIYCQEGLMELTNQFGTLLLGEDQMARLVADRAPQLIQGDPSRFFELEDEEETETLEIEFEDEDGNKKTLILEL